MGIEDLRTRAAEGTTENSENVDPHEIQIETEIREENIEFDVVDIEILEGNSLPSLEEQNTNERGDPEGVKPNSSEWVDIIEQKTGELEIKIDISYFENNSLSAVAEQNLASERNKGETGNSPNSIENTTTKPEMTRDEQIEAQDKAISEVVDGERELNTNMEKGNFGEMRTDQDLREKGYERISNDMVTDLNSPTHKGIDGVYYNENGHPQYIIVDSKYGSAELGNPADGKQMSETWIDRRLDNDIGKERADEIRLEKALNPDNVGCYVAHVDAEGNVKYDELDENANVIREDVKINA